MMATNMKLAVLLPILILCTRSAHGQSVRVMHDARAETIGLLFRLAGAPDFSNGVQRAYNRDIDSTFAPFKRHAVFVEINRLRGAYGLSLSSVTSMAPQITDASSFAERAPIDAPASSLNGAWRGAEARKFLESARDFSRVAPLSTFLATHQPLFDSATTRLRRAVDRAQPEWFTQYFGAAPGDAFIVSPLLVNAGGNFAADFIDDSTHERYAYLGVTLVDSMGFPAIAPDVLPTVIHEFSHSFVNPLMSGQTSALRGSGERMFRAVQTQMRALAYTSWPTMLNESMVRASVIRYVLATDGPVAASKELSLQQGLGFVWMDELVRLLGEYESQRSTYPTFASFLPRVVDYFDALAPRLDRVMAAFDSRRPSIISTSIADSARAVDPATTSLIVRFDRPVDPIVTLVGNHGGDTPPLTAAAFDSAHTTLTLGISLRPDRDYVLPLGPGAFVSRDGYPLRLFVLRFRTAAPREPSDGARLL